MYNIGDTVWVASFDMRQVQVPCPVCFGNKAVVVILGNGDEVCTECGFCSHGFEGARGYIIEYTREPRAESMVITGREIQESRDGVEVTYTSGRYILNTDRVFVSESEALACAYNLEEAAKQNESPKYKNEKSYSWNVGYHLGRVKNLQREIDYHKSKAKICSDRSRK